MRLSTPKRVSAAPYTKTQRMSRFTFRGACGAKDERLTIKGLEVRSMGEKFRREAAELEVSSRTGEAR